MIIIDKVSLKALRVDKDLTQEEVAKYLGISLLSYRQKEIGKREFLFSELLKLKELYSVSIDVFKNPKQ